MGIVLGVEGSGEEMVDVTIFDEYAVGLVDIDAVVDTTVTIVVH